MSEYQALDDFLESVMRISPQYINIFGGGMPGMAGGSAATEGAANSGADVVLQLQRSSVEFAKAYHSGDAETIKQARKEVTSKIMVVHTLGVIPQKRADELLDQLHEIVKGRNN